MKLIMAILSASDVSAVAEALTKEGYPSTVAKSTGGFLHRENAILYSGVDDTKVRYVISIIERHTAEHDEQITETGIGAYSLPRKIKVGGASVFVLDVEQFIHL